jgi:hypothetical protein
MIRTGGMARARVPVLALATLLGGAGSSWANRPFARPLSEIRENSGQISFRRPDGRYAVLDLATGTVLQRGWNATGAGWRAPARCAVQETCVFPSGVFVLNRGRLAARTERGAWESLYDNGYVGAGVVALYGIGDCLLIESAGLNLSMLECLEARSGRQLWAYVYAPRYSWGGPYFPAIAGAGSEDPFAPAREKAQWGVLGLHTGLPYAGTLVLDPDAVDARAVARRTLTIGWVAFVFVVVAAATAWRLGRAAVMIICVAVLALLLLSFGYIDNVLRAGLFVALMVAAGMAWVMARTGGRVLVGLIVSVAVGLLVLPDLLR